MKKVFTKEKSAIYSYSYAYFLVLHEKDVATGVFF